jgi:hypothetical protein
MMHLEYLVPVILLLIWIINALIRNAQEERQTKRPTRQPGESLRTPGRSQTEIERFLEEVNRRRRQAAERRGSESTPVQVQAVTTLRRPEVSVPRPQIVRPAMPQPLSQRLPPDRGKAESIVIAEIVSAAAAPKGSSVAATPPTLQNVPMVAAPEAEGAPTQRASLTDILGNADGLRAAWLLREILGPPRCRQNGL